MHHSNQLNRLFGIGTIALTLAAAGLGWPGSAAATIVTATLQNATATFSQTGFTPPQTIDGSLANGWAIFDAGVTADQTIVWETAFDLDSNPDGSLKFRILHTNGFPFELLGRFRLSYTTDSRSLFADGLATGGDVTASWFVLAPLSAVSDAGATMTVLGDNSILVSGTLPTVDGYTIDTGFPAIGITGFRLEAMTDASLPTSGPGRQPGDGNFVLSEIVVTANLIPEPSTVLLFGVGGILLWRRRRAVR